MPVYGTGIVPSAVPYGNELSAVTRRGFIPKMVVQIYQSSPLLAALLSDAQTALGGVSSISLPVQGNPMTQSSWTGYTGSFDVATQQQGAYLAEFNLKALITPVTFLGMEGALQMDHAVVPLIEARMNDAGNNGAAALQTALYGNSTNTMQVIGLPGAVDDGTNASTYGNQPRSNSWWQSKRYAAGSVNPTRANVLQYIVGCQKYGRVAAGRGCKSSRQVSGSAVKTSADEASIGLTVAGGSDAASAARSLNSGAGACAGVWGGGAAGFWPGITPSARTSAQVMNRIETAA